VFSGSSDGTVGTYTAVGIAVRDLPLEQVVAAEQPAPAISPAL